MEGLHGTAFGSHVNLRSSGRPFKSRTCSSGSQRPTSNQKPFSVRGTLGPGKSEPPQLEKKTPGVPSIWLREFLFSPVGFKRNRSLDFLSRGLEHIGTCWAFLVACFSNTRRVSDPTRTFYSLFMHGPGMHLRDPG